MLKKMFKFLLVLTILIFSFNSRSIDVSALTDGNYEYELINNNKEVRITKYKGKEEYVYLPNTIKGKKVRELGGNSFRDNDKIKEVIFNSNLETITFKEGLTKIYSKAFKDINGDDLIDLYDLSRVSMSF